MRNGLISHRRGNFCTSNNKQQPRSVFAETLEPRLFMAAQLVKDINTMKAGADLLPGYLTAAGSIAYLTADDGTTGDELWKTNGTAAGTALVKDINPGPASSFCGDYTTIGSITYFNATDTTNGSELWRTDGTAGGTFLVKDINPGSVDSIPTDLTAYNGLLYFFATDGTHGRELWESDGTSAGTQMVVDINPGAGGTANSYGLTRIAVTSTNKLMFLAFDGTSSSLYTSTGAVGNKTLVKTLTYPATAPGLLASTNGNVFYTDVISYIYQSDGTAAGTITADSTNVSKSYFTIAGSYLYFVQNNSLLCVGGTTERTVLSSAYSLNILGAVGSNPFFTYNGSSLYYANTGGFGTVLVQSGVAPSLGTAVNGSFYYTSMSSTGVYTLYKTNGLASGSSLGQINTGGTLSAPTGFTAFGSKLLFINTDSVNGTQPWVSDGTVAGTGLLKAIYPGTAPSYPILLNVTVNGKILFLANDGITGTELWETDGTTAGTIEVKDINPGIASASISSPLLVGNKVYFSAYDPTDGYGLWVTDGTTSGTQLVTALGSSNVTLLGTVNGLILLSATDSTHGTELWRSDGTAANTQLLYDIYAGPSSSYPSLTTNLNGFAYFSATDATHGTELWRTDGTAANTSLVDDIYPGSSSSGVSALFLYNNLLLFSAESTSSTGFELWESDGTPAGTALVKDLYPGSPSSQPKSFAIYHNLAYFVATNSAGSGLWSTDGTAAGTTFVAGDAPNNLVPLNGKLYFSGNDGVHAGRLFASQGTASTTGPVNATTPTAIMNPLTAIGGRLFFVADDGSGASYELWTSDGTSSGTMMVQDLFPGPFQGASSKLVGLHDNLYLSGDDSVSGSELYRFPDIYAPFVYAATASVADRTLAHSISFSFSEDISSHLSASSLQLLNLTTGKPVTVSSGSYSYNASTNTATFALPDAALADGRYKATIPANLITDQNGNTAAAAATMEFLSVAGTSGNDTLRVQPSGDGLSIDVYKSNTITFSTPLAGLASVVVTGGNGDDSLSISPGPTLLPGGYAYDGGAGSNKVQLNGTAGTHTIAASSVGLVYDTAAINLTGVQSVTFDPAGGLDALTDSAQLSLASTSGTARVFSSLNLTGTLDINNNSVDLPGSALNVLTALVQSGFANGSWTGTGINSSAAAANAAHLTAVGIMQNNQGGTPIYSSSKQFGGTSPAASDVLVKYTYYGDTDLDGKVDATDYSRIDSGFVTHASSWFNGDFNYDGSVNGSDYTLIDNAFNTQGTAISAVIAHPTHLVGSIVTHITYPAASTDAQDSWFKKHRTPLLAN